MVAWLSHIFFSRNFSTSQPDIRPLRVTILMVAASRELLPLPAIPCEGAAPPGLSRRCRQRRERRVHNCHDANAAIRAINELYHDQSYKGGAEPTVAQQRAVAGIAEKCAVLSELNFSSTNEEAFRELLNTEPSQYECEAPRSLASYRRGKVALPRSHKPPMNLLDLLDEHSAQFLRDFDSAVLLDHEEWNYVESNSDPIIPYMDPVLRSNPKLYHSFVEELFQSHIVDFTSSPKSHCTVFFVIKKDGTLRMVTDARSFCRRCRQPPNIQMGSGSSWGRAQLPTHKNLHVGLSDVVSFFFRLGVDESIGAYFSLPRVPTECVERARGLPVGSLDRTVKYYPYFKALPMGWSWSFYFSQAVHIEMLRRSQVIPMHRLIFDTKPFPDLSTAEPFALPYCDNIHVGSTDPEVAAVAFQKVIETFEAHNFECHETVAVGCHFQSLGVIVDGVSGVVRPTGKRLVRAVQSARFLQTGIAVSGRMLSRFVGHLTCIFLLERSLLSLFSSIYKFVRSHDRRRLPLWPSVAKEVRWAEALLPLAVASMRRPFSAGCLSSDSSGLGFCVSRNVSITTPEIKSVAGWKERWRFKRVFEDSQSRSVRHRAQALALADLNPYTNVATALDPKRDPRDAEFWAVDLRFPDVPAAWMRANRWGDLFAGRWGFKEDITVTEGRAAVMQARWICKEYGPGHFSHLGLLDNMGCVLAFEKGRSSSFGLMRSCRKLCALSLSSGRCFLWRWVPSELNRSDFGSRHFTYEADCEASRLKGFRCPPKANRSRYPCKVDTRKLGASCLSAAVSEEFARGASNISTSDLSRQEPQAKEAAEEYSIFSKASSEVDAEWNECDDELSYAAGYLSNGSGQVSAGHEKFLGLRGKQCSRPGRPEDRLFAHGVRRLQLFRGRQAVGRSYVGRRSRPLQATLRQAGRWQAAKLSSCSGGLDKIMPSKDARAVAVVSSGFACRPFYQAPTAGSRVVRPDGFHDVHASLRCAEVAACGSHSGDSGHAVCRNCKPSRRSRGMQQDRAIQRWGESRWRRGRQACASLAEIRSSTAPRQFALFPLLCAVEETL